MNKRILNLAIPNVISNITIPLLGMIDLAIAGRMGSSAAIGALAIGTAIFNFIYWNCAFIRMGTSGLTAQALGARRLNECTHILTRSATFALGLGLILLICQRWVGIFALSLMNGSDTVQTMAAEYFYARIWAAPATVSLYAIHGWFIGMQNSKLPMIVAIFSNIINVVFSLWFVYGYNMGVAGIAWGTVVAQYGGLLLSWIFWAVYYGRFIHYLDLKQSLKIKPLLKFIDINKDIFLRTACIVVVYTFFTSASSGMGDTLLAVNTLLMQLFTLFSYMSDGLAYAAESLVGKFVGARNTSALRQCIRYLFYWSLGVAIAYVAIYIAGWRGILSLFTDSEEVIESAKHYVIWVVLVPLTGFAPFLMDGILLGATRTRILRNAMFLSLAVFFGAYYGLLGAWGNNALWFAFILFMVSRGTIQWIMTNRLRILYDYSS